jgi:hypothetical protein
MGFIEDESSGSILDESSLGILDESGLDFIDGGAASESLAESVNCIISAV